MISILISFCSPVIKSGSNSILSLNILIFQSNYVEILEIYAGNN